MTTNEIWKDVPGFKGLYEVSSHGRVKSLARKCWVNGNHKYQGHYRRMPERILQNFPEGHGFVAVNLHDEEGGIHQREVGELLLETFVCPRPHRKYCRHVDGNLANNTLANLRWDFSHFRTPRCRPFRVTFYQRERAHA